MMADGVVCRAIHAIGRSAKLPVTSSRPSSTIMTKPTGKISAPTRGCPVWTVAPMARLVANPSRAPDRQPRISRSSGPSRALAAPACTMFATISAGFTLSMVVSGFRGLLKLEQRICQPLHLVAALQQNRRGAATMFADE
jgi:hypothetical protein